MGETSERLSVIKSWLKSALASENLTDLSVKLEGNPEKGDGYIGDLVFIHVEGIKTGQRKQYDLVLKCAKNSNSLRESLPVQEAFLNEITFFDEILPVFAQFQKEKNSHENLENSVAKYFGKFVSADMEVLALQDLKKLGYDLWDRKKPLTRNHVNLVIKEYAKFHAISGALQDQRKEQFDELANKLFNSYLNFMDKGNGQKLLSSNVRSAAKALEGQVDGVYLKKFGDFENQVGFILKDMFKSSKFSVIAHADGWNNNFMYQSETGDLTNPSKVLILDWQLMCLSSPVRDLSYFLFSAIASEDINSLDEILLDYHTTFSDYLRELGSDAEKVYPLSVFLEEWQKFAKFGLLSCPAIVRALLIDVEDVSDISEVAEMADAFIQEIKDTKGFADRMKYIVEYAGKHNLL